MNRFRFLTIALLCVVAACGGDDGTTPELVGRPTEVVLSLQANNTVVIDWRLGANATAYIVQRATPPGDFATIITIAAPPFTDVGLPPGTYSYRIASTNGRTTTGWASAGSVGFD